MYWVCYCVNLFAKLKETLNSYLRTVGPPKINLFILKPNMQEASILFFFCKNIAKGNNSIYIFYTKIWKTFLFPVYYWRKKIHAAAFFGRGSNALNLGLNNLCKFLVKLYHSKVILEFFSWDFWYFCVNSIQVLFKS